MVELDERPDGLHAAVNLGPFLALWLLAGETDSHEHLISSVHTPHHLNNIIAISDIRVMSYRSYSSPKLQMIVG